MRTPARLAQDFADEVRAHEDYSQAYTLERQRLYGVWRKPLDAIQEALNLLGRELLGRLNLSGATMVNVQEIDHRLVFDWRSDLGDLRVEFEPTNLGVRYRIEGGSLNELSISFAVEELACGIVVAQLRKLILPKL